MLEEERKGERSKSESMPYGIAAGIIGSRRTLYKTCKKDYVGVCWDERPDLVSKWLQVRKGIKRKHTESATESATAALAYSF